MLPNARYILKPVTSEYSLDQLIMESPQIEFAVNGVFFFVVPNKGKESSRFEARSVVGPKVELPEDLFFVDQIEDEQAEKIDEIPETDDDDVVYLISNKEKVEEGLTRVDVELFKLKNWKRTLLGLNDLIH